ncbi:MAG TPA: hypothetical protein VM686_15910, partial [Polyangiaceae bacterium]|nr:hypothetical protein [Polyangiaceae bacterium]
SAPAPAVVQAPPAPPAFPGVSCADANAAAQLRFFACTNDCAVHDAAACETLGDLHAVEEGLAEPVWSAGACLRAWNDACELSAAGACVKRDRLSASLAERCRKKPGEACVVEGHAVHELRGEAGQEEADRLFLEACNAGFAEGCVASGELHMSWEPRAGHQARAERAYQRGCWLGAASGCCSLISIYESRGDQRAANAVVKQAERIGGAGCGHGGPLPVSAPRARVKVNLAPADAKKLTVEERAMLQRTLMARGAYCYDKSAPEVRFSGKVRLSLEFGVEGAVTTSSVSAENEPPQALLDCLRAASARLALPRAGTPRSLAPVLELGPPRP